MNPVRKLVDRQFVPRPFVVAVVCADTNLQPVKIYEILFLTSFPVRAMVPSKFQLDDFCVVSFTKSVFDGSPAKVLFSPHVPMLVSPILLEQHLLVDSCGVFFKA